jgi:hypothetical protein
MRRGVAGITACVSIDGLYPFNKSPMMKRRTMPIRMNNSRSIFVREATGGVVVNWRVCMD